MFPSLEHTESIHWDCQGPCQCVWTQNSPLSSWLFGSYWAQSFHRSSSLSSFVKYLKGDVAFLLRILSHILLKPRSMAWVKMAEVVWLSLGWKIIIPLFSAAQIPWASVKFPLFESLIMYFLPSCTTSTSLATLDRLSWQTTWARLLQLTSTHWSIK